MRSDKLSFVFSAAIPYARQTPEPQPAPGIRFGNTVILKFFYFGFHQEALLVNAFRCACAATQG